MYLIIKFLKKNFLIVSKKKLILNLVYNKIFSYHVLIYVITLYNLITIFLKNKNKQKIIIIFLTILLGMFWSFQEVLWGAFWNWNLIELTIYFILFIIFILTHKKSFYFIKINLFILCAYTIVNFNHLPLSISVHNFVNNKLLKLYILTPIFISLWIFNKSSFCKMLILLWFLPNMFIVNNYNKMNLIKIISIIYIIYITNFNTHILFYFFFSNNYFITLLFLIKFIPKKIFFITSIHKFIIIVTMLIVLIQTYYYILTLFNFFWKKKLIYYNANSIILKKTKLLFLKKHVYKNKLIVNVTNGYLYVK